MKSVRLLLLSTDDGPSPWMIVSGSGEVLGRGLARVGDVAPDEALSTVVIVPGHDVLIRWLVVPGRTDAQLQSAAGWLLRDSLGQTPDRARIIVGPPRGEAPRLVAVTAQGVIEAWTNRIDDLGFRADVLLPDSLLLEAPADPDDLAALQLDDRLLVRGQDLAFSGERELGDMVLAGRPVRFITEPAGIEALMVRAALKPEINLLARGGSNPLPAREWRRTAALAAVVALSPVIHTAIAASHDELAARGLEARSRAAVSAAWPDTAKAASPSAEVRRRMRDRPFPGGVVSAAAILSQAIQSVGQMRLESLALEEGRVWATVSYEAQSDLQTLTSRMLAEGVDVSVESTVDDEERVTADIVLRSPA